MKLLQGAQGVFARGLLRGNYNQIPFETSFKLDATTARRGESD